jgi:hypothetical protein
MPPPVAPARLADLIMEELREGFPLAGNRASAAEVSTVAAEASTAAGVEVFTVAEATGNPFDSEKEITKWSTTS